MAWKVIKELPREYRDESYILLAEKICTEGKLRLEIVWAQIMYSVTIDLLVEGEEPNLIYDCMVFCDDRIEKYGHQLMRITKNMPVQKLLRLDSIQKDGVLNHYLSEKYNVEFKSELPDSPNA